MYFLLIIIIALYCYYYYKYIVYFDKNFSDVGRYINLQGKILMV